MDYSFRGRTVLVTGGSRGIGRVIAVAFARQGANVAICYRTSSEAAAQAVEEMRAYGVDSVAVEADVSQAPAVRELVEVVVSRWSRLDALVNNASPPFLGAEQPFENISLESWELMLRTALTGAFLCSQAALSAMRRQRFGRIVNVSTGWGIRGAARMAHYSAAKAGLLGLTTSLAAEVGAEGILVNAVAPGLTRTETVASMPDQYSAAYRAANPLHRLVEPSDVANAVLFLASPQNNYVNGHVLAISGGLF